MTVQMKRLLTVASGKLGAPAGFMGKAFNEALSNGWLVNRGYPQNSMTCRYGISDGGRETLRAMA